MDDDPSRVAVSIIKFNVFFNKHSLHVNCGLCFFAFYRGRAGV